VSSIHRLTRLAAFAALAAAIGTAGAFAVRSARPTPSSRSETVVDAPSVANVTASPIEPRAIDGKSADREVTIVGSGFFGTSFGPFVRFAGQNAVAVVMDAADPAHKLVAYPPAGLRGHVEVVVENPDRQSVRAFVDL